MSEQTPKPKPDRWFEEDQDGILRVRYPTSTNSYRQPNLPPGFRFSF